MRRQRYYKTGKLAHTRLPSVAFRSWSRFLAVSLQVTWVINPTIDCYYFLPGPQLGTISLLFFGSTSGYLWYCRGLRVGTVPRRPSAAVQRWRQRWHVLQTSASLAPRQWTLITRPCSVVCVSVCLSVTTYPWAVPTRLNQSTCSLSMHWVRPRNHIFRVGPDTPGKGQFIGAVFPPVLCEV